MAEQVRIRTASDLFSALLDPRLEVRLAVLKSLLEQPKRALDLGPFQGKELPPLLLKMLDTSIGTERRLLVLALCCFRQPEITQALLTEFQNTLDVPLLFSIAGRLIDEPTVDLEPFLWTDPRSPRARVVARLWSERRDLSPAQRLRVALLGGRPTDLPGLDPETLDRWIDELAGPLAATARHYLDTKAIDLGPLWEVHERLDQTTVSWLVDRLCRAHSEAAEEVLRWCLARAEYAEQAYLHCLRLGVSTELETEEQFLASEAPRVRAAAISRGVADSILERFLGEEVDYLERLAALERCGDCSRILSLLSSRDWRVRRAAAVRLASLNPQDLEPLRKLAKTGDLETRVAAGEALRLLGEVEWLEDNVILESLGLS